MKTVPFATQLRPPHSEPMQSQPTARPAHGFATHLGVCIPVPTSITQISPAAQSKTPPQRTGPHGKVSTLAVEPLPLQFTVTCPAPEQSR